MAQPIIHLSLIISPPIFSLSDRPTLITTGTLDYTHPITIHTWGTVFSSTLAQKRHTFFCFDLTDDEPVNVKLTAGGQRCGFMSRQVGNHDNPFLVTFYPYIPVALTEEFSVAIRHNSPLKPGHRYRFGLSQRHIGGRWMHGTREDVMTTERGPLEVPLQPDIMVHIGDIVEFGVKE